MKNESGKSIVILLILTILIIIGAVVVINYAKKMMEESKTQDLMTNMLLMQAEVKKGLEEVCFRTVNLNSSKQEDLTKINEIKNQYLKGITLSHSPIGVQEALKNVPDVVNDENCYYLNEETINEMGIENVREEQYGYFIVKYDFENANVEVINTKGANGKYTLTQIVEEIENANVNNENE
jgi:hypothetical protein